MYKSKSKYWLCCLTALLLATGFANYTFGQKPQTAKIELGSKIAKNGFKNETEIAGKFNNWRTDDESKLWLVFMGHKPDEIESVLATKPHGEKADVQVKVKTKKGESTEGISIKLPSASRK